MGSRKTHPRTISTRQGDADDRPRRPHRAGLLSVLLRLGDLGYGGGMTSVAFVSYEFAGNVRRVGPLELREAAALAKELARRKNTTQVRLEEWAVLSVKEVKSE